MRVLVAGAGIGGLATALSLHAAGITDVTVYEAVEEIRPQGVGISLLPHAVGELTDLGLYDDIAEIAVPATELIGFDHRGTRLWSEPRGLAAGHAWPQFSVHRGELQMLLLRAQLAWLGPMSLRTGMTLRGFEDSGDRVRVTFAGPGGRVVTEEADVLIAADGVDSAARALLHPRGGPAAAPASMLWRGTSPASTPPAGDAMVVVADGVRRFMAFPIREAQGGHPALLNWIAERPLPGAAPQPHDWNRPVDPDSVLRHFDDWDFDWLDVPSLIADSDVAYECATSGLGPLPRWSHGRVALLGDAAHAAPPLDSSGASDAILDARALAEELATRADPVDALAAYDSTRRAALGTARTAAGRAPAAGEPPAGRAG